MVFQLLSLLLVPFEAIAEHANEEYRRILETQLAQLELLYDTGRIGKADYEASRRSLTHRLEAVYKLRIKAGQRRTYDAGLL